MPLSPDPTPCQPETLQFYLRSLTLGPSLPLSLAELHPPLSLLPVFSFSSLSKDRSEEAQFFLKSKKQKSLYVGVCLRNNRLLFIKAPFILLAGMCFLSSRGWDGSMEPSQRLPLLISKAATGVEKCCACGHVGTTRQSYSDGPQELSLKQPDTRLISSAVLSAK